MDEVKNKFKGEFRKVDINKVKPNDWNPKESIDENEENKRRYEEIKNNIAKKGMYLPIIVRTYQDEYQIIDGFHRWKACLELGYTEIMIWDLGNISKEEAQGITLDSIYLMVPVSEPLTAQIVKQIQLTQPEALKMLPFNDLQIQEYLQLAEFDFKNYNGERPNTNEQGKQPTEITCPKCGHKFTV